MYKQILLRPTAVVLSDEPQDVRLVKAFQQFCNYNHDQTKSSAGANAFTRNWLAFAKQQDTQALIARHRFLARYEWPSLWETQEVQDELYMLWLQDFDDSEETPPHESVPEHCHDREKPRATLQQYVSLVGTEVALNLEGIARARLEKRPRQYQSDAAVHQAYMQTTTGGGAEQDNREEADGPQTGEAPKTVLSYFEPVPWDISSLEDMQQVLDFKHRVRLTPFAKELLELPCMHMPTLDFSCVADLQRAHGADWRNRYLLASAPTAQLLEVAALQSSRMEISHKEEDLDIDDAAEDEASAAAPLPTECFSNQDVYATPSAYISALICKLPTDEQLTRDQTLFVARFAQACDEAWKDEQKPPNQRKVHHMLLLGQGGSGKTHVVQKLVFTAVCYIWPSQNEDEPTLMVVASSNAQAKNISTVNVKGRTMHNASGMRVQQLINTKMRPGNKQKSLVRLWNQVRVLIIEEVSMVAAANYNMLDFRSMCGRSLSHDVSEVNYKKPDHHFGRIPIVIHLGDFLQLSPTANIGLIQDVNAKREDGSYKYAEPPDVEIQHAIRLFKAIPHVFELRGTKRFKPGDPLIQFLTCMRTGRRIPQRVWKIFEKTFATDNDGVLDPRHRSPKFSQGFWMSIYWETLARQMSQRAQHDSLNLGVPMVFLQAVDECNSIDRVAAQRLLNVPNMHTTGHIHGVLPSHVGMRCRLTVKFNSKLGLVQEQKGTIVDFLFKDEDRERYNQCAPGQLFRPRYLPAGESCSIFMETN